MDKKTFGLQLSIFMYRLIRLIVTEVSVFLISPAAHDSLQTDLALSKAGLACIQIVSGM